MKWYCLNVKISDTNLSPCQCLEVVWNGFYLSHKTRQQGFESFRSSNGAPSVSWFCNEEHRIKNPVAGLIKLDCGHRKQDCNDRSHLVQVEG